MGSICKGPNERNNDKNNPIKKNKIANRNNQILKTKQNQEQPTNNLNNNNIIKKEEDNLKNNNNTNNNIKKPVLEKYDPKMYESTNTQISIASSNSQVEMILDGQKNSQYIYKSGDIDNNNFKNYFRDKKEYANLNEIPLSESSAYFNNNNTNFDISNENKPGSLNRAFQPKFPNMQSQKIKYSQNNFNKGNKVDISLGASGAYLYYPRGDNGQLPDLQNIPEQILGES